MPLPFTRPEWATSLAPGTGPDLFATRWHDPARLLTFTFVEQLTTTPHAKTVRVFAGTCEVRAGHPHYPAGSHAVVGFLNEEAEGDAGHHLHQSMGFCVNWQPSDQKRALRKAHPHEPHFQDVSSFTGHLHYHNHQEEQPCYLALSTLGTQAFKPEEHEGPWLDMLLGHESLWLGAAVADSGNGNKGAIDAATVAGAVPPSGQAGTGTGNTLEEAVVAAARDYGPHHGELRVRAPGVNVTGIAENPVFTAVVAPWAARYSLPRL